MEQSMSMWSRRAGLAGLALGCALAGPLLRGQSLSLPGSDPVNIGRSGTGVAFGRSLEAAALNPALLITLQPRTSAYVAAGEEMQSTQFTLLANQRTLYTTDRNRFIPALGVAWKPADNVGLGLVIDNPWMRHGRVPVESPTRFLGQALDLGARRLLLQAAWNAKTHPGFSIGVGLGVVKVDFESTLTLRTLVPPDGDLPSGPGNLPQDLMEVDVAQKGSKIVLQPQLGLRWAVNPRWTLGASWQAPAKGTLGSMSAWREGRAPVYYAFDGYGPSTSGAEAQGTKILARSTYQPGDGSFYLPGRIRLGVRQRKSLIFTWEFDLSYVQSAGFRMPTGPRMTTPSGVSAEPVAQPEGRSGMGASLMGELALGKRWMLRAGAALEPALYADTDVNPMVGGSRSAAFSAGASYRVWGGELQIGYQLRLAQDHDSSSHAGLWLISANQLKWQNQAAISRVEGMGHLWSIGFKKSF